MALPAWQEEELSALLQANKNLAESSPLTALLDLAASTMDLDYFLEHQEEFDQLPDVLVDHMQSLPGCKLRSPKYFPLVVKAGRRCIKIPYCPLPEEKISWSRNQLNSVVDLIIKKCPPGSLEKFGICTPYSPYFENCTTHKQQHAVTTLPGPDPERLHALLRKQPGLQEIDLGLIDTVYRETLISIIGQTCHDLRSLSMRYSSRDIDLDLMRELVDGCPLLQTFVIAKDEIIEEECAMYALQHLKHLVRFPVSIPTILKFSQSGGILPPSFRPSFICKTQRDFDSVALLQNVCPKVAHLTLYFSKNVPTDLTRFKFKSVKSLLCSNISNNNIPQIEPFLQMCGSEIVELQLFGDLDWTPPKNVLDMSMVTEHCPIVQNIYICSIPISKSCTYSVTPQKVKFLRCMTLMMFNPFAYSPPDDFLYPIICNGVLEHLTVSSLSPRLRDRLTSEMRAAVVDSKPCHVFPKLTHLDVGWATASDENSHLEEAVSLVILAPRLKWARLPWLSNRRRKLVKKFLNKFAPLSRVQLRGWDT